MKKTNVLVGVLFAIICAVPVFAQDAEMPPVVDDSNTTVNDEGYSVDDAEYYGGEEGMDNTVMDGETYTEEMPMDESMGNEEYMEDNAVLPEDEGALEAMPEEEELNAEMPAENGAE